MRKILLDPLTDSLLENDDFVSLVNTTLEDNTSVTPMAYLAASEPLQLPRIDTTIDLWKDERENERLRKKNEQLRKENIQLKERLAGYEKRITEHDGMILDMRDSVLDVKARFSRFSKYERLFELLEQELQDKGVEI
jgi:hypothetical protein